MALTPFTKIVIRTPQGRHQVVTRKGISDPNSIARLFGEMTGGIVVSVRHQHPRTGAQRPRIVAIHHMSKAPEPRKLLPGPPKQIGHG